jgi:elongation factor G
MKVYQTNQIRNLVLLGNSGSGKTMLAESFLLDGGIISRRGDIDSKNTVSDYHEIEHERECSVYSTVMYTEYDDHKINFIDTPGSDDFVGAAVSAMNGGDLALVLINAQNGVEVGTETFMRYAEKFEKPVVLVANQLDTEKSNFDKLVENAKEAFGPRAVIAQYPLNEGEGFDTVIDVVRKMAYKFPVGGGAYEEMPLPSSEEDRVEELYAALVEAAAESDEGLMEKFFENDSLTDDEMREGLKKGIKERGVFPIFCISAKHAQGSRRLLEFVIKSGPNPTETNGHKDKEGNVVAVDPKGGTCLFVFKNFTEPHLGEVSFFKVISGTLKEGDDLINHTTGSKERLSQIFAVAGKNREKVSSFSAGDIGAAVKLKDTKVFSTIALKDLDAQIAGVEMPEPKYRAAIKAKDDSDDEKLGELLTRLHQEDPSLIVEYSRELKQIILHGQGEYHLNIVAWLLSNLFKLQTEYLTPKIPYRETITKAAQASYRHKKQSGGSGQFGEVHMIIEPHDENAPERNTFKFDGKELILSLRGKEEHKLDWGGKLIFYNCIVGGSIDARFLPAILKGLMEKLENGPLTGSYARDIRVYVYDGKMHPVDSNEISFKLAGAKAFSDAFKKAGAKILEPVYDVEVMVPADRMGDVMSDLQGRRAIIQGMSSEGRYEKLMAKVPLSEMNKYSTSLSSLTNGRATYSMKFADYSLCPPDIQEKLIAAHEAEQDEDD